MIFILKKFRFENMKGGYYIGNFEPSAYKTKNFEVAYVKHPKNDTWVKHFHKIITEINFVISGKVRINKEIFVKGDIFVIEPNEIVDPLFLEDTELIVTKTPSETTDKFIVPRC